MIRLAFDLIYRLGRLATAIAVLVVSIHDYSHGHYHDGLLFTVLLLILADTVRIPDGNP